MSLTPEQVSTLKKGGLSAGQIQQINAGAADAKLKESANKILRGSPMLGGNPGLSAVPQSGTVNRGGYNPTAVPAGAGTVNRGGGFATPSASPSRSGGDVFGGQRSIAPAGYLQGPSLGSYGSSMPYGAYEAAQKKSYVDPDPTHNSWGGAYGTKEGAPGQPPTFPGYESGPAFPDLGSIDIPQISPKDFTEDATRIADSVFAPLLESLSGSKTNIGQQGERSRQVLSGLYQNMVNDIATTAAQSHQQYEQQKTDVGQRGQQLQQNIGAGYQSSQQGVADIAKTLGLESAVPEVNQESANDQAWLQGIAGGQTNAMQNYFGQQQQGEQDLAANRQDVARTSGVNAQENNLNQVAQALQGVDQQIAGVQTDKARTALDIGQNLTSQDLSAQQANAGYAMQGQSAQQDALLRKWQAESQANSGLNEYNLSKYSAEQQAQEAAWNRQMDQAKLDLDTLSLNNKTAGEAAGGGVKLDDFSAGPGKARASLVNTYGADGDSLANLAQQVATTSNALSIGDPSKFVADLFAAAKAGGASRYTDDQLRNAAQTMWAAMYQKG